MDKSISNRIEELRIKSIIELKNENYINAVELLENAWELLPDDKNEHKESFMIVSYILEISIRLKDEEKMKKWVEKITKVNPEHPDCGDREMWVGKINYELGNFDKARENFIIANKKSRGRCFRNKDIVYKQFFDSTVV